MKPNKTCNTVKILSIMITCMMIVMAINIFIINQSVIVATAGDKLDDDSSYSSDESSSFRKKFFIYVFNKSMSILELSYKNSNDNDAVDLAKYFVDKTINFDYKDPKSYLGAQIPMMKEMEGDLQVSSEHYGIGTGDEDYDTRIYIETSENLSENKNNNQYTNTFSYKEKNMDNSHKDDVVIINRGDNGKNNDDSINKGIENSNNGIEIVSTPAPLPEKVTHDKGKPLILIYHTHGTESYKPESIGNYHSLNRRFTVISVGEELKKNLENSGYNVIHDDTIHDYPSYQGSYSRSLQTLNKNLGKYPSLKIIFDVHRDGIDHIDNLENYSEIRDESYVEINGEKVARFSMVVGGENENFEKLKKFAYYIKAISDEMYPGLSSGVILKKYRYNEYKSDYYALFEIGNNANSIEESLRTAKYLGKVIDRALRGFVNFE